jgi:RND family efflux transporter MFP subunit
MQLRPELGSVSSANFPHGAPPDTTARAEKEVVPMEFRMSSARALVAAWACTSLVALPGCEKEAPPPPEVTRPVKILEIVGEGGAGSREYPGRIKAGQYSEMGFEVEGRVTEFVFKEGDTVEKDAVLAKIDPRDYEARRDSAVARMEHARAERDRYKIMYEKEVKPFAEYEMRMKHFEVTEAELREAQKAVDDTILRAPFGGVMARKLVEEYENVLAKQSVLILQNDTLLEIKVNVPERDLAAGNSAEYPAEELTRRLNPRVHVSSLPGREFPARMKEIAKVADPTTRTFEATLLFDNPGDVNILGGMTAKVVVDLLNLPGRGGMLVPAAAVVGNGGADDQGSVWGIDPQTMTASKRAIVTGELRGSDVEVRSGLAAGDWIAVSGVHQLRDGMQVRRIER